MWYTHILYLMIYFSTVFYLYGQFCFKVNTLNLFLTTNDRRLIKENSVKGIYLNIFLGPRHWIKKGSI